MQYASFIASSPAEANAFGKKVERRIRDMAATGTGFRAGLDDWLTNWTSSADSLLHDSNHGIHPTSQTRRELNIHERQRAVLQTTREYLDRRSPLAHFVTHHPARLTWHHLPVAHEQRFDAFMSFLRSIGAPRALAAATRMQARDGAAMLYIDAPGRPDTPLEPGMRWRRLVPIPRHRVLDDLDADRALLDETGDTLLRQHGFEFLDIELTARDSVIANPTRVHGSRLIAVNDDPSGDADWWWTPPILDNLHDALWDHLDTLWSRKRLHFEGDPILVEVPVDNEAIADYWVNRLDQPQRDTLVGKVRDGLRKFMSSGKSANLATVAGFKTTRLGHGDLPDPTPDYRATASLVSNAMGGYPVSVIMASTKGSERVDDSDVKAEATWLRNYRGIFAEPILDHLLLAGKRSGIVPARTPPPAEYYWPQHHVLSPNDAASVLSIESKATRIQWEMGNAMPPEIRSRYPSALGADELPPAFALRGRLPDGTNADTAPQNEPGSSNRGTTMDSRQLADLADSLADELVARTEDEWRAEARSEA